MADDHVTEARRDAAVDDGRDAMVARMLVEGDRIFRHEADVDHRPVSLDHRAQRLVTKDARQRADDKVVLGRQAGDRPGICKVGLAGAHAAQCGGALQAARVEIGEGDVVDAIAREVKGDCRADRTAAGDEDSVRARARNPHAR